MAKKSLTIEALQRDADAAWAAFFTAICSSDATMGEIRRLMKIWERMDRRVEVGRRLIPPTVLPRRPRRRKEQNAS